MKMATDTNGNTEIQIRDAKEPEPMMDGGKIAVVTLVFKLVCIAVNFPEFETGQCSLGGKSLVNRKVRLGIEVKRRLRRAFSE